MSKYDSSINKSESHAEINSCKFSNFLDEIILGIPDIKIRGYEGNNIFNDRYEYVKEIT